MKKIRQDRGLFISETDIKLSDYTAAQYLSIKELETASVRDQKLKFIGTGQTGSTIRTTRCSKREFENIVCWSQSDVIPMFTTKYFIRYKTTEGISYNKKTKTFNVWFSKKFINLPDYIRKDVINFLGKDVEFLDAVPRILVKNMSIRILNKIAKGKITNSRDYVKSYLKETFPKLTISSEIALAYFKDHDSKEEQSFSQINVLSSNNVRLLETCSNIDKFLLFLIDKLNPNSLSYTFYSSLQDLAGQAFVLDKTFSYCWSEKKLNEVHAELSREIAEVMFEKEPIIEYNYDVPVFHPFIKILVNSKEIFAEGKCLQHCLYGTYGDRIAKRNYFAFTYNDDKTIATIGVRADAFSFIVDQIKTRKNGLVSEAIENQVKTYVNSKEMQTFFNNEVKKFKNLSNHGKETNSHYRQFANEEAAF